MKKLDDFLILSTAGLYWLQASDGTSPLATIANPWIISTKGPSVIRASDGFETIGCESCHGSDLALTIDRKCFSEELGGTEDELSVRRVAPTM